ncbi:hypothetical protein HY483_02290 [Candidatus Woesearchaeota archaeon]|nr:hypothetical protein [Candidatus Woesearchaeota archaeon]
MNIAFRENAVNVVFGVLQTLSTQLQSTSRGKRDSLLPMIGLVRSARSQLNAHLKNIISEYKYESPNASTTRKLSNAAVAKKVIGKDDAEFLVNLTTELVKSFDSFVSSFERTGYSLPAFITECSKKLYEPFIRKLQKYPEWQTKRVTLAGFVAFAEEYVIKAS